MMAGLAEWFDANQIRVVTIPMNRSGFQRRPANDRQTNLMFCDNPLESELVSIDVLANHGYLPRPQRRKASTHSDPSGGGSGSGRSRIGTR